ncbi:MAG: hypothetical protein P1V20_29655 [Verrucomicrobiales bacterium]|nr:hypothetical protein [Verrucomicrobiales bacterium]
MKENKWFKKQFLLNIVSKGIGLVLIATGNPQLGSILIGGSGSVFNIFQGLADGKDPQYSSDSAASLASRKLVNTIFMKVVGVILILMGQVETGTALLTGAAASFTAGQVLAESGSVKPKSSAASRKK